MTDSIVDFEICGLIKNTKLWMSWEQNIFALDGITKFSVD